MQDNYYKGKAALIDRIEHALRGIWYAWEKERNFKLEFLAALAVLFSMFVLPLGALERSLLVLIIALVLSLEIFNSVFERVLDITHPHFSPEVKRIKDTMAGAVLLAVCASLLIGGFIFIPAFLAFDPVVFQWVGDFRTPFVVALARLVTFLGNWQLILAAVVIASPWFFYKKRHEIFSLLFGSVVGGEAIVVILKAVIERARPPVFEIGGLTGEWFSFPSGHAFLGAAFWLTVGYILTDYSTRRKYLWFFVGIIIVLIALSRLVLSLHWLSDIVGGLLLGCAWFFLWFGINRKMFTHTR